MPQTGDRAGCLLLTCNRLETAKLSQEIIVTIGNRYWSWAALSWQAEHRGISTSPWQAATPPPCLSSRSCTNTLALHRFIFTDAAFAVHGGWEEREQANKQAHMWNRGFRSPGPNWDLTGIGRVKGHPLWGHSNGNPSTGYNQA